MAESLVQPFEVCKGVPEFLTPSRIRKKEGATFSSIFYDEGSHYFLFMQWQIFSHPQIIRHGSGRITADTSLSIPVPGGTAFQKGEETDKGSIGDDTPGMIRYRLDSV